MKESCWILEAILEYENCTNQTVRPTIEELQECSNSDDEASDDSIDFDSVESFFSKYDINVKRKA